MLSEEKKRTQLTCNKLNKVEQNFLVVWLFSEYCADFDFGFVRGSSSVMGWLLLESLEFEAFDSAR